MNELTRFFQMKARPDRGVTQISGNSSKSLSYEQIYTRASQLAVQFKRLHLRERFLGALWMDDSIESMIAFMAIILADGIPVPLHTFYTVNETIAWIQFLEADIVCCSPNKEEKLITIQNLLPPSLYINGETGATLDSVTAAGPSIDRRQTSHSDTAVIFLSSGSTGKPKGIQLSATNIRSNMESIQDYIQLSPADSVLISKSFGYCSTVVGEWFVALFAGSSIQLTEKFIHPFQMISHVKALRPTFLCTVPSTLVPLIKSNKWDAANLDSLRQLLIVGGPIAPEMLKTLAARIPHVKIIPSYGLTEASPRVAYLPYTQLQHRPNSVGIPIAGVTISINKNGANAAAYEEGEVIINGDNVMLGYYADPERSQNVLTEQGLHTNDIGYRDEDGYLYLTGRKDNALNIGGHTVYPEEIEKRLLNMPGVAEVAVTGIEDEVWGTRIFAYIVPSAEMPIPQEQELLQYCLNQLQPIQRPKEFHFVEGLPLTKTGKIDRLAIKQFIEVIKK